MTRTLKILGLGLFAALAMSAFSVLSASATESHTGGHFALQSGTSATIHGHGGPGGAHQVKLSAFAGINVECTETYTSSVSAAKVPSVTVNPHYTLCNNNRTVTMNGCHYTFTIRNTNVATKHSAVHLICNQTPGSGIVEVHDANCTIKFGPQTITNAVTYTTAMANGVHAVTATITATGIKYEKHGACEFLSPFGTGPHTSATMSGTALLTGSSGGVPVGLTATGTDNKMH